jgi:hypothetical protein
VGSGWLKFAIQGSTYARALENAATRGGRALSPAMQSKVTQLHAQPNAKLQQGLGDMFRDHARGGEITPTPQQRDMQKMLAKVPWAGAEHGGHGNEAETQLNARLRRRGLDVRTPAGQPSTHEQIAKTFGPPKPAESDPSPERKVPYKGTGPSPFLLMDDYKRPGVTSMGGQGTHVGPAPAPHAGQAGSAQQVQAPRGREQTQVKGQWRPGWQRFSGPSPGAVPPPAAAPLRQPTSVGQGGRAAPTESTAVLPLKVANLPLAAGIGIPLAVGGGILASKPGIRADIADRFGKPGDIHQKDIAQAIPDEVQGHASRAAQALAERGINPAGLRIAVDAPSGAGKTVLSKALAGQLGLRHHGLDWRPNLRMHQMMGGGDIEKTPYAPHAGEILEHQQLLRSYDPELFDVAIHIHKDPETIKQQVLKRGRGARTHDLLDYEKSIGVGRKAFETLGGEAIDLGGGVMMKVRPQGGWGNALDEQLAQMGIDPSNLTRHQKLLSLHSGKRTDSGAGWTPYVKNPFTGGETAALAASVPLGVMAARALTHH